jgi:hypothetical protein
MNFNGQSNIFFCMFISFTCDLHLKLDILNPLNIFFYKMVLKMNPLPCSLFFQNFKALKFLNDLVFHQVHPMNMYFHRRGHVFVVQKIWNQLYDFMPSILLLFTNIYFRHLIPLVYRIQNDINITSKLIFINLRRHHIICWHTTTGYNYNNVK